MFLIYTLSRSWFLVLRAQPPVAHRSNGGEERKTHQSTSSPGHLSPWLCFPPRLQKRPGDKAAHQHFSESNDKENEIRKHIRWKRIRETRLFFTSCPHETTQGEFNSPNSICCFVFFHTWLSKL